MKRIVPVLIVLGLMILVAGIVVTVGRNQGHRAIRDGNERGLPIPMEAGRYQCAQCAMTITAPGLASQAVDTEGHTWFFDDVGCLAEFVDAHRDGGSLKLWTVTLDSGEWVDARTARYVRDAETIMNSGFAATATGDDSRIGFDEVRALNARGETLNDPRVKEELLGAD